MLAIGLLGGFIQVGVFTWIQQRVPPALPGRAMLLLLLLGPISEAVTGWVMKSITLTQLFAASGSTLVVVAVLSLVLTPMRRVADAPATASAR